MNKSLSIVIIGRNEEKTIGRCIESALSAAQEIPQTEVIYVDSASTDNTVPVVESFGVRVISLPQTMKLSPSAGRYVGTKYATGKYILFLDADTLIYRNFLPAAIKHFEDNSNIAGINGWLDDLNEAGDLLTDVEIQYDHVAEAKWLRGPACLYRRSALEKCGTFNPTLMVEEEAELGLRLVKNGWNLIVLPIPMACHTRCFHQQTLSSVISAFRRDIQVKRLGELTNTIACAFKQGFGFAFCWLRLKTTIIFAVFLIAIAMSLILPEFLYPTLVSISIIAFTVFAVVLKKRSINQALVFFVSKILGLIDLFAGLMQIPLKKDVSLSTSTKC